MASGLRNRSRGGTESDDLNVAEDVRQPRQQTGVRFTEELETNPKGKQAWSRQQEAAEAPIKNEGLVTNYTGIEWDKQQVVLVLGTCLFNFAFIFIWTFEWAATGDSGYPISVVVAFTLFETPRWVHQFLTHPEREKSAWQVILWCLPNAVVGMSLHFVAFSDQTFVTSLGLGLVKLLIHSITALSWLFFMLVSGWRWNINFAAFWCYQLAFNATNVMAMNLASRFPVFVAPICSVMETVMIKTNTWAYHRHRTNRLGMCALVVINCSVIEGVRFGSLLLLFLQDDWSALPMGVALNVIFQALNQTDLRDYLMHISVRVWARLRPSREPAEESEPSQPAEESEPSRFSARVSAVSARVSAVSARFTALIPGFPEWWGAEFECEMYKLHYGVVWMTTWVLPCAWSGMMLAYVWFADQRDINSAWYVLYDRWHYVLILFVVQEVLAEVAASCADRSLRGWEHYVGRVSFSKLWWGFRAERGLHAAFCSMGFGFWFLTLAGGGLFPYPK